MNDRNVHQAEPNAREDLEHTDTIATGADTVQPAGYEQSINPVGEVPVGGDSIEVPDDEGSIGGRVGHDPSNLGDDIPDQGDLVHPAPIDAPVGKTPGM
jgi:hypothetical protein